MTETNTSGLHKNFSNILNTNEMILGAGRVIYDSKYNDGEAVTCSTPGVEICRTPVYPKGTFSGTYSIGFFYESTTATVQGTELMRFEVYEDGVLMPEDTSVYDSGTQYQYDLNHINHVLDYGLFQNFTLNADSTYQIIIKTSPNLTHDAILDYIIFEKVPQNNVINGDPILPYVGIRNGASSIDISTYGTQLEKEIIWGSLGGSLSAGATSTAGYTYNSKFKTIIFVSVTIRDSAGKINANWYDTDYNASQVLIYMRNNSSVTWNHDTGDVNNIRISVEGYI